MLRWASLAVAAVAVAGDATARDHGVGPPGGEGIYSPINQLQLIPSTTRAFSINGDEVTCEPAELIQIADALAAGQPLPTFPVIAPGANPLYPAGRQCTANSYAHSNNALHFHEIELSDSLAAGKQSKL